MSESEEEVNIKLDMEPDDAILFLAQTSFLSPTPSVDN